MKQPLSLFPPPHPVVREKSEDLAKRWVSPINHFIFSAKWIYSKMRYASSPRLLAVTQSSARARMCSARTCTLVQPWQDVGTSLTRCNACRACWDRLFLTAKRDNEQLLPHRTDLLSYDDAVFLKDTQHHRSPSLIVGKHIENWGHIVWSGQPGKKWPPPKRLSGCDRAVKAAQLESLSWLVAWLSCFAALQGNLA